jgi:hypothetical protein
MATGEPDRLVASPVRHCDRAVILSEMALEQQKEMDKLTPGSRGAAPSMGWWSGVRFGVDMRRVKAQKDAIAAASRAGLTASLESAANIVLCRGHARFVSPQAVEVAGGRLRAERIFINAGGRARVPPMPGLGDVPCLTNASMMAVDFLPDHPIIVGAGDLWVTEYVLSYAGRPSYTVGIMEFRDGKVARETHYFGDPFAPEPSRAQWVECMS